MTAEHSYVGQSDTPDFGGVIASTVPLAQDRTMAHVPDLSPRPPLRPMENRIVVKMAKLTEKVGSIFIPESAQAKYSEGSTWTGERAATDLHGTVVAVGPGKEYRTQDGFLRRFGLEVRVGDSVYFGPHAVDAPIPGHKELRLMTEEDILAIFRRHEFDIHGEPIMVMDRVLVKKLSKTAKTGIMIPDTAQADSIYRQDDAQGIVVAIGRGNRGPHGTLIPVDLNPGDRIAFVAHRNIQVRIPYRDGDFVVMREEDVLGVIE